ncbi:MAG: ABC transporter ATP-binding protein [Labedaea sp.]
MERHFGYGIARAYGRGPTAVVAVHGISRTIAEGARIAVTGPSGCGKSTLLHLMAGVETPTTGTVEWPGLSAAPPDPIQVGLVFQTPNLLVDLDVTENVALPLLLSGVPVARAAGRTRHTLASLGIDGLADALPEELSGGQAHRVAIARAVVALPRLIVADEPTGQLDHDTAQTVISVLDDLADTVGAALVIATHDETVAAWMLTRWVMHDGALATEREPVR